MLLSYILYCNDVIVVFTFFITALGIDASSSVSRDYKSCSE